MPQADVPDGEVTAPRAEGVARHYLCYSDDSNSIALPGDAALLVPWLQLAERAEIHCLGIVTTSGGRLLLPLTRVVRLKLGKFDRSLREEPPEILAMGDGRVDLARYLAHAWDVTVNKSPFEDDNEYVVHVVRPEAVLPEVRPFDVVVRSPDAVEIYGPAGKKNSTMLDAFAQQYAARFQRVFEELPV